jgi:hypothetical protein
MAGIDNGEPAGVAPVVVIDQLLDEAWTLDCAIRLHQPVWASVIAERLAADLVGHAREVETCWTGTDPPVGHWLATETEAVRSCVLAVVDELRRGIDWPCADVYQRVERLIHREACAAGDAGWCIDD